MEISLRLKKIADKVAKDSIIVDVGTDHSYVPIYLYERGIIKGAIATDVAKGPIQNAQNNVKKFNLDKKISIRCGFGLDTVSYEDKIDTCIIAGVGGDLTIKILEDNISLVKTFSTLVLQPQRSISKVRKYLHNIKFKITEDEMFKDEDKIYTLIVAKNGIEKIYSEKEYLFGKYEIERKCSILKEYIILEMYKMKKVMKKINNKNKSFNEIEKRYNMYKEVKECL